MWNKIIYNKLCYGIPVHTKNTFVHHRWQKNHFCFDKACTARKKKLLLNLLDLVLMDLNRRLDGRGQIGHGLFLRSTADTMIQDKYI